MLLGNYRLPGLEISQFWQLSDYTAGQKDPTMNKQVDQIEKLMFIFFVFFFKKNFILCNIDMYFTFFYMRLAFPLSS